VIDLDVSDPLPILARKLTEEITTSGGPLQVGLPGDRRLTVTPERAPLAPPSGVVGRDWVFLLTGGARGITAEIARDLARHYRPKLILAGRAALNPDAEPPEIARAVAPGELKSAMVARMSAGGGKVKIADVEAAFQRIVKDREIRRTLEELRAHGAQVEYHAVDARDEHALGALIERIYAGHGRLDVVIHGAGVIEDKLIRDKTPESFDRVVHTKADSSFSLGRLLRPDGLRCLIFMSSITAAFGNRGQADYAVANGFMNGLALVLAARWAGRVVAMNWGPWDQVGMASEEVRKQFLARGIVPIPVGAGCEAVRREIECAGTEDALVCLGEGPWSQEALPDRSAGGARGAARMSS
jgi:NAD(P)-dependent dehydrogenase (short-subunit alcohol dehydrogenase family)